MCSIERLALALRNNDRDAITHILDNGYDIHANNVIRLAVDVDASEDAMQLLIDRGADIHAGYNDALVLAIARRRLDTARFLLERGRNDHDC